MSKSEKASSDAKLSRCALGMAHRIGGVGKLFRLTSAGAPLYGREVLCDALCIKLLRFRIGLFIGGLSGPRRARLRFSGSNCFTVFFLFLLLRLLHVFLV